jgi:putative PEP-CTERM system TPR-repeat lipoprotein
MLWSRVIVVICLLAFAVGCSSDPEKQKQAYLESGNRFFDQKKFAEAVVEYRNAIQIDPSFGEARERLSTALLEAGDVPGAARELILAADLLPQRLDVQLRAGTVLLLARRFDDAKVRAEKVLASEPRNVDAQIIKANALAGLKDLEAALAEVEEAIRMDPGRSTSFTALGAVQVARGRTTEAEDAFKKAVATDPRAVAAHLALGNFYWTTNRLAEAESAFTHAVTLEPRNPLANRALATFFLASNRAGDAERFLTILAEDAREATPRLALADYYVMLGRPEEALKQLHGLVDDRAYGTAARLRIASVRFMQGHRSEAYTAVDEVLGKNPASAEALLTRTRFLVAEHKPADALEFARRAVDVDRSSAIAHFLLGMVQVQLKQVQDAHKSFSRVIELNPRAVAAQIQMANLELARGNPAASAQFAHDALTTQPQNVQARLLLAKSYLAERNVQGAERELRALAAAYPRSAEVRGQLGSLHLMRGELAKARAEFTAALALNPNALESQAGLIAIDAREGRVADARQRVEARVAQMPTDAATSLMAARAYALLKEPARAEETLKRLLERDPNNLQAYADLAQLYVSQKRLDEARTSFERLAERQPNSPVPHTMVGMIHQLQGRAPEATRHYELAVAADRRTPVAANNLAWAYAEKGEKLEVALELAKTAKEVLPQSAEVNDTLGFVYLQKKTPDLAISPLREAVKLDPANPRYRLRLGIALARSGQAAAARQEIEPVLRAYPDLPESREARDALLAAR